MLAELVSVVCTAIRAGCAALISVVWPIICTGCVARICMLALCVAGVLCCWACLLLHRSPYRQLPFCQKPHILSLCGNDSCSAGL